MKKFLISSTFLIGIILTGCGGGSDNAEIARLREENRALREQLNGNSSTSKTEDTIDETPQLSGPIGTYEFTDAAGQKWTLKLNSDDTATLESKGNIYYGSWEIYGVTKLPTTHFEEWDKINMKFPDSDNMDSIYMTIDIANGYIYGGDTGGRTYKAKNPRKRLEIKKIN